MFAKVYKTKLDLGKTGEQMQQRKAALMAEPETGNVPFPANSAGL